MKRKGAAVIQRNGNWCGITLTLRDKEITDLEILEEGSLAGIEAVLKEDGYAVAVENGSAYLFHMAFPFSDKRKIRLVIGGEIEERVPVSVDDLTIDFVETGRGNVLAAAIPKSLSEELKTRKRLRVTTIQSIAVLHALRFFKVIHHGDFVFLHRNGDAMVIMCFKNDSLSYLRQFFYSPQSNSLRDAMSDITGSQEYRPRAYVMVSDSADAAEQKQELEKMFHVRIDMPSLRRALRNEAVPEWLWPAVGGALLSTRPRGELNLTGNANGYSFLSTKPALRLSGAAAGVGIIVMSLFLLNYWLEERAYQYLVSEPARIYRLSFPKSPPIKDPARVFREKVRLMEKEPASAAGVTSPLSVLNEISSRIGPEIDVKISEFVSDEKEFTLSGTTVSFASVEKIKADLDQMKGVSQVDVQNAELAGNKQVKFKLRGKL